MSEEFEFQSFQSFDSFDQDAAVETVAAFTPGHLLAGGAGLAIVDTDAPVRDYLAGMFSPTVDTAASLAEMESKIELAPWVIILGPSCAGPEDLETVQRWDQSLPSVATVLVTSELSTQLLHKALRAGVKDVLSAPIDEAQLRETVDRVGAALPAPRHEEPKPTGTPPPRPVADREDGRIITVFSTKGGSGKSVTATNLSVLLAKRSDRPVVLIDGHLQFGDCAVMLKLQPQHTAIDAIAQLDDLEPEMLERMMTVHEPTGLLVLPAPLEPTFADQISGEQVARLVEAVRGIAGHVVVDLPAIFNDVVLNVIEISDEIILVAGLDIPNIKNVKIGLSTLQLLNVPKERLHLVMNRSDSKVKLNVSEVEKTLGVSAAAHVPSDVVVPISVNKGSPVVLSAPKSSVARAFDQLVDRFVDGEAASEVVPQQGRRKFFG
ncbi:MAG: P-loop NTPase [Actinomycetota bacterium]